MSALFADRGIGAVENAWDEAAFVETGSEPSEVVFVTREAAIAWLRTHDDASDWESRVPRDITPENPLRLARTGVDATPPSIAIRVNDRVLRVIVDTGFEGDLLVFDGATAGPVRDPTGVDVVPFGQSQRWTRATLESPVTIGMRSLRGLSVITPPLNAPHAMSALQADGIIGMGILSRSALWIDYDRRVFRFARSAGATDGLCP